MNVWGTVTTTSPGFTPHSHEGETQGIRAAADGDRMAGATERGKRFLELFYHRTTDEAGGVQNLVENGGEFLLHFYVRSNQIKKRNAVRVLRIAHFVTSVICSI